MLCCCYLLFTNKVNELGMNDCKDKTLLQEVKNLSDIRSDFVFNYINLILINIAD